MVMLLKSSKLIYTVYINIVRVGFFVVVVS